LKLCHQIPERSIFIAGKKLPVCARCTGLFLGYLLYPFYINGLPKFSIFAFILMQLPMLIDGTTQFFLNRESTNWLRLLTGFLAGISQHWLLDSLFMLLK